MLVSESEAREIAEWSKRAVAEAAEKATEITGVTLAEFVRYWNQRQ